MFAKPLLVGLFAILCVGAAGGGAFLAVRQNSEAGLSAAERAPLPGGPESLLPVHETEAVVLPSVEVASAVALEPERPAPAPAAAQRPRRPVETRVASDPAPRPTSAPAPRPSAEPVARPVSARPVETSVPARPAPVPAEAPAPAPRHDTLPYAETATAEVDRFDSPLPPLRLFEDLVVPAASVVGLHIETPVSSERARLEDRVEARVVRDVVVDGRTAIPAGSRAIGAVTLVERGGKMQDRARLGVRFNTLVLADGTHMPMRTDTIFREGDSPSAESARKIGGAAAGGAILGAIIGGKKGAIVGGATGAAGGTAVVVAGDRNPATLPVGAVVTVRLSEPLTVEVEKR